MDWLISRLLAAVSWAIVGALLGLLGGIRSQYPGAVLGAAIGTLLYGLVDGWRGHRLMSWLRGQMEGPAPRDRGFWGELGYRVERGVQRLRQSVAAESARLDEFLAAIEASPNGVLLLDARNEIEWCNRVAADHFGLDPQRDRSQPIVNLVRSPMFVAYLQGSDFSQPVVIASPGLRGTVSISVRPYGEGKRLVLSQDITERERNEAMRRDFVANVSHEIRTPLTVLAGFLETMTHVPLDAMERQRVSDLMGQQTRRMQALVGDLLTLAQLEGSPRPPADRWVAVKGLVSRVLADAQVLSGGRHAIDADEADTAEIAGAEPELVSALTNLVHNAVRYTPEGGAVKVSWTLRGDGAGELVVRDSGIGIDREHIPRITERFYRVDSSRSRDTGGTGLGLSIVKHVAQRHGGELAIHSEPGKGSSFKLIFPASRVRRIALPPEGRGTPPAPIEPETV